ncbi:MAG: TetR/AcrR family transcriptional regulator [Nocardioidaceae bacterium]
MRISSAERRGQLIDAAMRVAKRDGVAAVSTRTVAAEAQATPGIVHYVFASMADLLREMIKMLADEQVETVRAVQVQGADLRDSLVRSFEAMWATVEADPGAHQLTFEVTQHALREPRLAELAGWQYECYFDVSRQVLDAVSDAARIDWQLPVETLARLLVATNDGVVMAWLVDRDSDRARRTYMAFVDHLCLLATPRA